MEYRRVKLKDMDMNIKLRIKKFDWFLSYIYFYLFVLPWHFSKSQISILSVILFIWATIKFRKEAVLKCKQIITFTPLLVLFLFIIYTYISTLWSDSISIGFEHVNTFNKYYFLFIPALLISLNKENAIIGIKVLVLSFGCYSLYSILIYLGFFNSSEYGFQPSNPTGHLRYLIATQYMVIAFFSASLFVYYMQSKKEKFLFLLIALLSFFALFINNSRTAQLTFFLIFIIFSILLLQKKIFNIKVIFLFFIIIFSSIYFLYENNKLNRFVIAYEESKIVFDDDTYNGSTGLRMYFNKVGFDIFKNNYIVGTGPKDNRLLLQSIQRDDPLYKTRVINHFHSEHMDTLTAYGLVGYLLLVFSIIILIYNLRKESLYYYLSLVVFLSLFFNSFANKTLSVKPLNYVYIIMFLLFAIIAFKSQKNKKDNIENHS